MPHCNCESHVPPDDHSANSGRQSEFRALPAILACRGSSLSKAQHLVLVHMSVRASRKDGACWAAVATLAVDTNLDTRTVRRVLRQLEDFGVLEAHRRPGRTTWYRIFPDRVPRPAGRVEPQAAQDTKPVEAQERGTQRQGGRHARGDTAPPGEGHGVRPGRAHGPPGEGAVPSDPSKDPDLDPSFDPNQQGPRGVGVRPCTSGASSRGPRSSSAPRTRRRRPHETFDEIVSIWADRVRPSVSLLLPDHKDLDPASGVGALLDTRLHEVGRDDVALVLQWYGTAADDTPRAPFLRERITDLSTLMRRPKFDEYLGFARSWWAAGHPERPPEPTSRSSWTPEEQRRGNEALRQARLAQEARVLGSAGERCAA